MDWITSFTNAMDYIEENLTGEIDWAEVGRRALCSGQQFARTFALIIGIPLSEYVRRRRLTQAAQDLQMRGDKVIDVAMRYGYASPTAFQRAFVIFHGVTPSQARKPGARLQAYPPISFQMTIQGGIALQYRIEEKPAFRVVGAMEEINMVNGENFVRIPKMWEEFPEERSATLGGEYADGKYDGMFGVMSMAPDKPDTLVYGICVSSERKDLRDWMQARDVAAATYAVFETSLAAIQEITKRIYAEWLPSSGYAHAGVAEFEFYPNVDMSDQTKYMCEIWIPIVKK